MRQVISWMVYFSVCIAVYFLLHIGGWLNAQSTFSRGDLIYFAACWFICNIMKAVFKAME